MTDYENKATFTGAYYIGKDFVKKGVRKDKEGKDVEWTLYKARFKKSMEDSFPMQMSAFNNVVDDLQEGEYYNVGYTLSAPKFNEKAGKDIQYKSCIFAKKAKLGEVREEQQQSPKPILVSDELRQFYEQYAKEQIDNDCIETFKLTWFANKRPEEYDAVHAFAKTLYEKPVMRKVETPKAVPTPEPTTMVVEEEDIADCCTEGD